MDEVQKKFRSPALFSSGYRLAGATAVSIGM